MEERLSEDAVFRVAFAIESPALREEYLRQVSVGEPALYDRVNALLKASCEDPDFLESPATGVGATVELALPAERVGATIGSYILREQIAEGGMGVVYVAEQLQPVTRKVALKVIKPGMDTKQVIARFEAERQALAMMDHPNIAKVLDAGSTESGRPYFVMDLVRGLPFTEYCDKQKLGTRQRLELFITVCHAVQHAHQKGIIHRDIKPSNVLVTRNGDRAVPKVIDFGVAKATNQRLTERTIYTQFSQMIGTPLYMSPEQAEMSELDVDTRSDVYSLGGATRAEAVATAGFGMARDAVDRLMTRVAEEHLLNTPKMEQMRELLLKDALEFYQQMAKLQSNDPSVRLDKALAQSRLGQIHGQLNNRDAAEDALGNAVDQLRKLHDEFPQRQQYTAALADTLHHYGNALFDTSYRDGAADNAALAIEAYDEAILLLEDLVKRYPDVAQHKFTLVETYRRRAGVVARTTRGPTEQVARHLERAESLAAELVRVDSDNPKFRFAYANALSAKAGVFRLETEEGRNSLNESVTILEGLIDGHPEIPEYRSLLAKTLWNMLNNFPPEHAQEDVKQRQRVVELHEQLATDFPSTAEYRADLSMSRMHLAIALRRNEELQAADDQYRIAETILLRLREDYPELTDYTARLAWVYRNLVALHYSQHKYKAAVQAAAKLVELLPKTSQAYCLRGTILLSMGRYEETLADLTHALELNPKDGGANAAMAWLLVAGPSDLRDPKKAVAIAESSLSGKESERSRILGEAHYRLGQYQRAGEELAIAVQNAEDRDHAVFGEILLFMAMTCGQLEKHEEAYKWFAQAEAWIEEKAGPEDVHVRNIHQEAAGLLPKLLESHEPGAREREVSRALRKPEWLLSANQNAISDQ